MLEYDFSDFQAKLQVRAALCSESHAIYNDNVIISGCFHTCNFFQKTDRWSS